jgi:hypothetical protein
MIKKIFALFVFLIFAYSTKAAIIGPEQAAVVGLNFWKIHATAVKDINPEQAFIVKTSVISENGDPLYYIFNISPTGFVIVSGDDAVIPILGYSFEGNYISENQPDVFTDWMNHYAVQIESVRTQHLAADINSAEQWSYYTNLNPASMPKGDTKEVLPLCATRWDQGTNYNYECPAHSAGPGGHCYAGCVATAMAQVMKFWNYPAQGNGSHSYYHPYYGTISADFSSENYEWTSMTNTINSSSKVPIATLIFHCGVSVDMYYTPLGSGSSTYSAKEALKNYFHYRSTINLIEKSAYTWFDWRNLLMNNLDDGKPILYSGDDGSAGHEWVCDGYQDTTFFHMNWGWSGANNGYFALDNLNSGNGNFSNGEQAVIDIIPNDAPYCVAHKILTDKSKIFGDGSAYSYYWNSTNCDWLIQPENATEIVLNFTSFSTEAGMDVVSVYNGSTTSDPLLGTFSGHSTPSTLTSTGGSMLVVFSSNASNQDLGWEAAYVATVVGENEYDLNSHLAIYPNPVQGNLYIHTDQNIPEVLQLEITNITGQKVLSKEISNLSGTVVINFDGIIHGVYMLTLTGQQSRYCSKLVVN